MALPSLSKHDVAMLRQQVSGMDYDTRTQFDELLDAFEFIEELREREFNSVEAVVKALDERGALEEERDDLKSRVEDLEQEEKRAEELRACLDKVEDALRDRAIDVALELVEAV